MKHIDRRNAHNAAYPAEGHRNVARRVAYVIDKNFSDYAKLQCVLLQLFLRCGSSRIKL